MPIPGGHITFAERFVDPAWSFALGWLYCASRKFCTHTGRTLNATRVQLGYHPPRGIERRLGAYWLLVGLVQLSDNRARLIGLLGTLPLALQCG